MKYVIPEMEIINFSSEDILLASPINPNEKEGYESDKIPIDWELG